LANHRFVHSATVDRSGDLRQRLRSRSCGPPSNGVNSRRPSAVLRTPSVVSVPRLVGNRQELDANAKARSRNRAGRRGSVLACSATHHVQR
jgi:hypothetical protein